MMKRIRMSVVKGLTLAAAAVAAAAHGFTYDVAADRPACVYACGETAVFTVTVKGDDGTPAAAGTVDVRLDNFGSEIVTNAVIDLAQGNPFRLAGTQTKPGFLRLLLPRTKEPRKNPHMFGVAYEPEKIEKGSPTPDDFDAFWAAAAANLDATVPLDPQLELLPERSQGAFNFWRVSFATCGDRRVYGFLSIPKDASAAKKYPVRFQVPAAGNGRAGWTNNMSGAPDAICMLMTVHPYAPAFNLDDLEKQFNANRARLKEKYGVETYSVAGLATSREDYYFYPAILGINRAVDWLAARPEVDLSDFTYSGTSQGGGFGLYLMGLNRHFTRGVLYVPAISDTMGHLKNREPSWPRPVQSQRADARAAAARNAPYFDGATFAARIRCPIRVAVGFSDSTCPPCGVYAAYNAIPVKDKAIRHGIWMTHSVFPQFHHELGAWQRGGAAADKAAKSDGARAAIARGVAWLAARQEADGHFSDAQMPALTALPLWALVRGGEGRSEAAKKAAAFVLGTQRKDGGFYVPKPGRGGSGLGNYNTSVCVSALYESGLAPVRAILDARTYIAGSQLTGDDTMAGGFGYDRASRRRYADLSNTSYALDAMRRTERAEDFRPQGEPRADVNWDKAVAFVSRLQERDGERAGGAAYNDRTPQGGAATNASGRVALRAYGSMSYAAVLSMCHAKLTRADPRVKSALAYCTKFWTVDENPGMGSQGLFYYYDILSRALSVAGVDELVQPDGRRIDWKKDLAAKILSLQKPDGRWENDNNRFWENDPVLATSFAVIALSLCDGR